MNEGWVREQAATARLRLEVTPGGRLVLAAIEAQGGLEAWYGAPTRSFAWEYSNLEANLRFKSHLVADNRTRRMYHELQTFGQTDDVQEVEARFAWDGEEAWISPPEMQEALNPRFWAATGYYLESIPFVLADPGLAYELLPQEELDGKVYDMVRVSFSPGIGDTPGDFYLLYVDPATKKMRALRLIVTFFGPQGPADLPYPEILAVYDEWTTVEGLTVPTLTRGYTFADGKKGDLRSQTWTTEISFSEPFDESRLVKPADAWVAPKPAS